MSTNGSEEVKSSEVKKYDDSHCEGEVKSTEMKYDDSHCEGADSLCVKLIASDEKPFFILRELAIQSETIKAMLSGPGQWAESETNQVKLREISSPVLEQVCKYLAYKAEYHESAVEIPEFPIAMDMCLELMMAANFLAC